MRKTVLAAAVTMAALWVWSASAQDAKSVFLEELTWTELRDEVRQGNLLSEAFRSQGIFPKTYVTSVMAGEKSGSLEGVIRRYVAYVKVISGVKRKTISALVYPAILLVLSCVVVGIIMLRVVPEFGAFYNQFGRDLPLSTRIIVSISNFAGTYFLVMLLGAIGAVVAFVAWLKQPGNRRRFDKWTLSIPMLGPIAQMFATSQAARTLATLLGGGIPLVNAIDVSARSIGNQYMAHELTTAAQQVREGRALASAMMQSGAFPDVAVKMVEVGESTGALQEMLNSLSEFYDEEIETSLTRFITIVEPTLLVIMGIIIAALLLSLYMPLFNLSSMIT